MLHPLLNVRYFLALPLLVNPVAALSSASAEQTRLGHDDHNTPLNPSFNSYVEQLMQDWHIPGLAIAVVHENKTWAKGFGYASLPDEPFTPHTLFQAASTTKSFTASLAALLVDNQDEYSHIDWQSPLHDILGNDFVLKDSYTTTHITLLDAMSHRTGMPRHDALWYDRGLDVKTQTYLMRHVFASAPFRTTFQYCNLFFTAVSHVLQTVTGRKQADLLHEWIFEPLGMNESYYSLQESGACQKMNPSCRMADSYAWNKETSSYKKWPLTEQHPPNGAGGVVSNVVDYTKWIRALMYESGPVSKQGHAVLKSPLSVPAVELAPYVGPPWYGTGVEGGVYRNERVFSHNGGISGYASTFKFLPDRKFGVVVFQNAQNAAVEVVGWRLIDDFLGGPKDGYFDMNKTQFDAAAQLEQYLRDLPEKLYPSVPSIPVQPRLPLQNYTGTYTHPGYGDLSISLEVPEGMLSTDDSSFGSAGLPLYATTAHQNILFTFRHVSGEHWLMEWRFLLYEAKVADDYKKTRFEIGADGIVQKIGIVMEVSVPGEEAWAWFNRIE